MAYLMQYIRVLQSNIKASAEKWIAAIKTVPCDTFLFFLYRIGKFPNMNWIE